jgi:hypothetical protein
MAVNERLPTRFSNAGLPARKPARHKTKTRNCAPHTPLFCQSYDSRSNIFGLRVQQIENLKAFTKYNEVKGKNFTNT